MEFSEDLKSTLGKYESDLQIQGTFLPEKEILDRYMKRGFGNAYDFNQEDRLVEAI